MTRQELYQAMEREKIIMYDEFVNHLERTPLPELVARWAGVLTLAGEHEPRKRRAEWLAMFMWNSTALTVGEQELARRKLERQWEAERKAEAEQKRRQEKIERELSRKKLAFWRLCSEADRRQLVENFLPGCDDFYRKFVREHYLSDLGAMSDRLVLLWFWRALPPFSLEETRPEHPNAAA